jgi:hypothetical protein
MEIIIEEKKEKEKVRIKTLHIAGFLFMTVVTFKKTEALKYIKVH